jgi:hypothetical protein
MGGGGFEPPSVRHWHVKVLSGPFLLSCRHTAVFCIGHRTVTRGLTDPFCVSAQWLGHHNGRNEQRKKWEKREKKSTLYCNYLSNYPQHNAGNLNIFSMHIFDVHEDCCVSRSYVRLACQSGWVSASFRRNPLPPSFSLAHTQQVPAKS